MAILTFWSLPVFMCLFDLFDMYCVLFLIYLYNYVCFLWTALWFLAILTFLTPALPDLFHIFIFYLII